MVELVTLAHGSIVGTENFISADLEMETEYVYDLPDSQTGVAGI